MCCREVQGAASWGWNRGGQTARQHSKPMQNVYAFNDDQKKPDDE